MGGSKADKALASLGAECALQEIHLSADTGELSGAGRLGIFLSHQIQLDTTVDADDIFHLTDAVRGVDVIDVSRMEELRLIIQPVL